MSSPNYEPEDPSSAPAVGGADILGQAEAGVPPRFPEYGSTQQNAYVDYTGDFDPIVAKKAYKSQSKLRSNLVPVCLSFLAPWLIFIVASAVMSFARYSCPSISWIILGICVILTLVSGAMALVMVVRRDIMAAPTATHPAWYCVLFVLLVVAVVLGAVLGDQNYHKNLQPYYDTQSLNTYEKVDPSIMQSHQMMDVGQISFVSGVRPNQRFVMSFRNHDTYCVTPITGPGGLSPTGTYDFWAVGTNCCSDTGRNSFHCGDYDQSSARAGLRVLDQEKEPFYRLAIQQAEAAYGIKSPHPVILSWRSNPAEELDAFHSRGVQYFVTGLYSHLIFQIAVVIIAIFTLTKVGRDLAGGSPKHYA